MDVAGDVDHDREVLEDDRVRDEKSGRKRKSKKGRNEKTLHSNLFIQIFCIQRRRFVALGLIIARDTVCSFMLHLQGLRESRLKRRRTASDISHGPRGARRTILRAIKTTAAAGVTHLHRGGREQRIWLFLIGRSVLGFSHRFGIFFDPLKLTHSNLIHSIQFTSQNTPSSKTFEK